MNEIPRPIRIAVTAVFVIAALFFVRWMWDSAMELSLGRATAVCVPTRSMWHPMFQETRGPRDRARQQSRAARPESFSSSIRCDTGSRLSRRRPPSRPIRPRSTKPSVKPSAIASWASSPLSNCPIETRRPVEEDEAALAQAIANRDVARVNLERTAVRALVPGSATNVQLRPGDYAAAGRTVMAVIDSDSLHIDGYFEETKLPRIHVGDFVRAYPMGHRYPIEGHVESIAGGIVDRERQQTESPLADINPTFNWVRLAQRVPVRIHIDRVPADTRLVSGLTTTVIVRASRKAEGLTFWPF